MSHMAGLAWNSMPVRMTPSATYIGMFLLPVICLSISSQRVLLRMSLALRPMSFMPAPALNERFLPTFCPAMQITMAENRSAPPSRPGTYIPI
jgi:hypothetical protein